MLVNRLIMEGTGSFAQRKYECYYCYYFNDNFFLGTNIKNENGFSLGRKIGSKEYRQFENKRVLIELVPTKRLGNNQSSYLNTSSYRQIALSNQSQFNIYESKNGLNIALNNSEIIKLNEEKGSFGDIRKDKKGNYIIFVKKIVNHKY